MANADALLRSGQISGAQWNRLNTQKGRAQPTRMAKFDDRGGVRDQGGTRDPGHEVASRSHIDKNQSMRGGGGVSGRPSKGGAVQGKGRTPGRAEINEDDKQRPEFPAGGKAKAGNAKRKLSRQSGRIPAQGGQYGGGGRDTQ